MIPDFLNSNFGTGIVGVTGVLLGLVAEWTLRRTGKVRAKLDRSKASFTGRQKNRPDSSLRTSVGLPEQLRHLFDLRLHYDFRVGFYNEKDVDAGLMDIGGAIIGPDGRDFIPLRGEDSGASNTINLPAHQWTYFSLVASEIVGEDKIDYAKKCSRMQVRAKWPNGRSYNSEILEFEIETYFLAEHQYFAREW